MNLPLIAARHHIRSLYDMELVTLSNNSGLRIDLLPNGALCAIRHCNILINQSIGVPPEGAPFRLWLRDAAGGSSLIGPATARCFKAIDDGHASWCGSWNDWSWTVHLILHADKSAWSWHVDIQNDAAGDRDADVVIAQDLGLGNVGAVRSNESYISHYIDYTIEPHETWGPVLFARQNLSQSGNQHPWVAAACATGAESYATDAMDVFGLGQRVAGQPDVLTIDRLPSLRRQGESACLALQAKRAAISPKKQRRFSFSFSFMPDHPGLSSRKDLECVDVPAVFDAVSLMPQSEQDRSIWDAPHLLHGESFDAARWNALYPDRVNEEVEEGILWSFFTEDGRHVVSAAKEARVERSHGHVLCGSRKILSDTDAVGTTVYAPGIFNAQIYYGNPNIVRLLTVVRDSFQRTRSCGQRVWVNTGDAWALLGSPSAFELGLNRAVWLYQVQDRLLELTTRTHPDSQAVSLQCRVREGAPVRWKITHQLALGVNELDDSGIIEINAEQDQVKIAFDPASEAARRCPYLSFELSGLPCHEVVRMGTDDMIWADGVSRGAPYVVVETCASTEFALRISAVDSSAQEPDLSAESELPGSNWQIMNGGGESESLARILPWFRHDAWIHLVAPHGLEQYGGAAWGVRDVCQGPLEWLLTEQRYEEVRAILKTVFAHQYDETGLWPQWFMLGQYSDIQQTHCHGDIMFWPVKALCDYAAAANDPGILDVLVPYSNGTTFQKTEAASPLSSHVDRVIENYRKLCIPGTALVAYGDGDWDDTLQPARAEMRDGMVSSWTVELAYQVFSQVLELYRRSGRDRAAQSLSELVGQIRNDFMKYLMPDGIVSGFSTFKGTTAVPLLHPSDEISGIQYRLLPMIRGVISGLFDLDQARAHREIIRQHLRFPDGVRLMNRPVAYTGGKSQLFQRAETAAYFGREVSLQYVHAHIRYTEAIARLGDGEEVWWGLQVVNPLGLRSRLANAAPRQANVYFSSSDADVRDRYEAAEKYDDIRAGRVAVKSGWRLYSSGPGLYLNKVRACLFGVREEYDRVLFDPVLPKHMENCSMQMRHEGHKVTLRYSTGAAGAVVINGHDQAGSAPVGNPYRNTGVMIDRAHYRSLLRQGANTVDITVRQNRLPD